LKANNTFNIVVLSVLGIPDLDRRSLVVGASPELCITSRPMFGEAKNTNKFCIATGGAVLASGEHVSDGLVAARSLVAARGLLAAHDWASWTARPVINYLCIVFKLAPGLVAPPGIGKVYSTHHAHDIRAFDNFLTQIDLVCCIFHFSFLSLHLPLVLSTTAEKVADDTLSDMFFKILADGSVSVAPKCPFLRETGLHRGPRGPR